MTFERRTWAKVRREANAKLMDVDRKYHEAIPMAAISEAIAPLAIAEDAILCGETGRAYFDLTWDEQPVEIAKLLVMWHRMESGRYEICSYIS